MTLVPKREYVLLLLGDATVFTIALWMTLVLRYLEIPSWELFFKHLGPFSIIYSWRVSLFPRMRFPRKLKGVLIASGPDAQALAEEVASDALCPFSFVY